MTIKEKILVRLTKQQIADPDATVRNTKLSNAMNGNNLNILSLRIVDDSEQWRGWVASYIVD